MADEFEHTPVPSDAHTQFRRCAACGSGKMAPVSSFTGTGQTVGTEQGFDFKCPDCDAEVQIRDTGALFVGSVISAFWLAVGYWALNSGILWYVRHWEVLWTEFRLSFFLMDIGLMLLSFGVILLSAWTIWTFLAGPLLKRVRNPAVGENRARTSAEAKDASKDRRDGLLSFFVYSLAAWLPLLAAIWLLDVFGIDVRGNGFFKNVLLFGLLGGIYYLARKIGTRAYFIFFGMIFWLALVVLAIFTFG